MPWWRPFLSAAAAALLAAPLAAQGRVAGQDPATRAFDLERRGQHAAAAEAYRAILAGQPNDIGALLGLERSLMPNGKLADMVPQFTRALEIGQPSAALYGLGVRVYVAAGQSDSARRMVERWAVIEPKSEAPYQELGAAALAARDRAGARAAYRMGREALGGGALAGELAQLATIEGDYDTAVTEWLLAVAGTPGYRAAAVSILAQVGVPGRPAVLRLLDRAQTPIAERIAAALTVRWGDPVGGIRRLERASNLLGDQLVEALQDGLDEVRGLRGREAAMAKAIGLEILGGKVPAQATRYWLESAQSYTEAGDQSSARRMLSRLAADPKSSPTMAASAASTLVAVLVGEGKMDEATKQFAQLKGVLSEDERAGLQVKVAEGWIAVGKLDRADELVAQDSTVDGLAVRGRIKLYQGALIEASNLLRYAGPFAGTRDAAVSRTTALALMQVIETDSLPALGGALLALERRDSAAAVRGLEQVSGTLPAEKGGAEVLLLVARVQDGLGHAADAERGYRQVSELKVPASAAAAGFELGRLLVRGDRKDEAIAVLEQVLVSYPSSAVAPQARRLLDQAKGAIPPA